MEDDGATDGAVMAPVLAVLVFVRAVCDEAGEGGTAADV